MPFPKTTGDMVSAADWNAIPTPLDVAEVTSGTAATLTLTVPSGENMVRVVGRGRSNVAATTTSLLMRINGQSTSGQYREQRVAWTGTGSGVAASEGRANFIVGTITGGSVGSTIFGIADVLLEGSGSETITVKSHGGTVPGSTFADAVTRVSQGHTTFAAPITTITLLPSSGSFTEGTRYRLLRA